MALDLNHTKNPLKDVLGRRRTTSLFWEFRHPRYPFLWTLAEDDIEKDGEIVPSLHRIYMSYPHIPEHEYEFAKDMFGSWDHWLRIQDSPEVMSYITKWREELEIRNKAQEFKNLILASRMGDVGAAKFLADKLNPPKRGRPSKEEKEGFLKQTKAEKQEMNAIQDRVLSLVARKKGV